MSRRMPRARLPSAKSMVRGPGGQQAVLSAFVRGTGMTRTRSMALGIFAAMAAMMVVVVLVYFKRHHRPDLALDDGTVVKDLSASDAGLVAGDRFESVRRRYLAAKPFYEQLDMRALQGDEDATIRVVRAAVERELVDSPSSRAVLQELPRGATEGLLRHVTLALRVLGGLPREEYTRLRAGLEDDLVPAVPLNLVRSYAPELGGEHESPSPDAIERTFARLYDEYAVAAAPHHVVRVADTESGWVFATFAQPSSQAISVIGADHWASDVERGRFLGGLSAAAFMFHRPSHSIGDLGERHEKVVRAVTMVVVEARDGTRFPVSIDCYFDPLRKDWRINIVFRHMAPLVVNTPTPAF